MKSAFGVYVSVPSALIATVPFEPCVTEATGDLESTSVSFAITSIVTAASSFVVALSSTTVVVSFIASFAWAANLASSFRRSFSSSKFFSTSANFSNSLSRRSAVTSVAASLNLENIASPPSVD